jgi:hypothetical protein
MNETAEVVCRRCQRAEVCGPAAMLDWLRRVRMVRRDAAPEPDLLGELFRAAAAKLVCPRCGAVGLAVRAAAEEDEEAWGMARRCEACGQAIARERLQALPGARLCARCQSREDRGELNEPPEYCPKCGGAMVVRPTRGAGVTRYEMVCPSCRR